MSGIKVIIFDFDGVLSDSLLAHLKFLEDMKELYAKDEEFKIPKTVKEGRKIIVTPMINFIKGVGFKDEEIAQKILERYKNEFSKNYPIYTYRGVEKMLEKLKASGFVLCIASANIFENIKWVLGPYIQYFKHILTLDNFHGDKIEKINEILKRENESSDNAVFVGDMMADLEAAQAAKVNFVATRYGWDCFAKKEKFFVAKNVKHLSKILSFMG
jgi:HAD superfamily hydrolase (TIGR01549 family)